MNLTKTLVVATLSATFFIAAPEKVEAGTGDFLGGLAVGAAGAVIGNKIYKERQRRKAQQRQHYKTQKRRTYTKKRTSRSAEEIAAMVDIQTRLNALNYAAGTPDGIPGRRTRAAIRNFQAANNRPITGKLTNDGIALLYQQSTPILAQQRGLAPSQVAGAGFGTVPAQPGVVQPGAVQPGFNQPGAVQPGFNQPGAVQPSVVQPGIQQPGYTQQAGIAQPGIVQPVQPAAPAVGGAVVAPALPVVPQQQLTTPIAPAEPAQPQGSPEPEVVEVAAVQNAAITTNGGEASKPYETLADRPTVLGLSVGGSFASAADTLAAGGFSKCENFDNALYCDREAGFGSDKIAIAASGNVIHTITRKMSFDTPIARDKVLGRMPASYDDLINSADQKVASSPACGALIASNATTFETIVKQSVDGDKYDASTTAFSHACKSYFAMNMPAGETVSEVELTFFDSAPILATLSGTATQASSTGGSDELKF
ncbi:MAG: peptidoglycan-binding protein [Pseudomonadota bacterium]